MTTDEMCAKAIEMANDVFSVKLEYQTSDLEILEEKIMPVLEQMVSAGKINEIAAGNLSALYGAYLGELMLRGFAGEKGYAWQLSEGSDLPVIVGGEGKFNPIAKVYKRLTQGNADDIRSFYKVAQAIVSGKLKTT